MRLKKETHKTQFYHFSSEIRDGLGQGKRSWSDEMKCIRICISWISWRPPYSKGFPQE